MATIIFGVCSLKNVSGDPAIQPRWLPRLNIGHRGKMQFLAYNSKIKAFRANLTEWNCLSCKDLSALKCSYGSNNPFFGYCPWIGNFKEMLQFLVIILNTIIDRDKLLTAIMFSKVRSTNKSTWPKWSVEPLRSYCPL